MAGGLDPLTIKQSEALISRLPLGCLRFVRFSDTRHVFASKQLQGRAVTHEVVLGNGIEADGPYD